MVRKLREREVVDGSSSFGLSVDIGTTWITVHVVDILERQVVPEKVLENPQSVAGLDVVTRIKHSLKDRHGSTGLTSMIRESVDEGVQEALSAAKIPTEHVKTVVIVGNTVMHHLFYGLPVDSLLRPPYTAEGKGPVLTKAGTVGLHLGRNTACYSPSVVESYVGPDALAVLLASNLISRADPSLTVDIGTNTEILLRARRKLLCDIGCIRTRFRRNDNRVWNACQERCSIPSED